MDDALITAVTVNYNTSEFLGLMLHAFKKLTKNPYKVIVCDNGSDSRNIHLLKKIIEKYDNVELICRTQTKPGSIGHAEALDILISKVNSSYTLVMDSDATFLSKHWDEKLLCHIDSTTKIIGPSLAVNREGYKKNLSDFPMVFATLFATNVYKNLNITCMPGDLSEGQDTCHEWKSKFLTNGYKGKLLVTRNTRDYKQGPFGKFVGVDEYYTANDELIACHFGRGASSGLSKYKGNGRLGRLLVRVDNRCGRLYAKRKSRHEIKNWFSKCYDIIDSQVL